MTRLTGKLSFEHQAKRKRKGEKDLTEKFKLINLIHDEYGLFGLTGELISIPDRKLNYHRMPDIVIPQKNIVIELDGFIHGNGDEISKREDDKQRDQDYKDAGFKLIIINEQQTNGYEISKVLQVLETNGIKNNEPL